jgi:hypothetical protein
MSLNFINTAFLNKGLIILWKKQSQMQTLQYQSKGKIMIYKKLKS